MALGFVEYLESHQIRFPETIAVTGFDDVDEARLSRAPLTTVRQPLYEQGREAARLLMAKLRGGEHAKTVMKTELVVRRSCGCFANLGKFQVGATTAIGSRFQFDAALLEQRQRISLELLRVGDGRFSKFGSGWEGRLLSALVQELKGDDETAFRRVVDEMLSKMRDHGIDPTLLHEVISVLWERLLPCTFNSPEYRTPLEALLDGARVSVCSAALRRLGADFIQLRELGGLTIRTVMAVVRASSLVEIAEGLRPALAKFSVEHLDIALFDGTSNDERVNYVLSVVKGNVEFPNSALLVQDFVRVCLRGRSRAGMYVAVFGDPKAPKGLIAMDILEGNAPLMSALIEAFTTVTAVQGLRGTA
jgi:hypothetical protein